MLKKLFNVIILCSFVTAKPPKAVIVIVVDQMSNHYLAKLRPFLRGGIKIFDNQGISFTNAFYDHALPGTGPGHTLLSTGTYASYHGIINNNWYDADGKKIVCDNDTPERAAVFSPNGTYNYGRSARNMMVDNLSDQLIIHSYPHANNAVWSVSLKSRAAISMAGKLGKALWFDEKGGNYTSSKAYFDTIPPWLKSFNERKKINQLTEIYWKPVYALSSPAYKFKNADNYKQSSIQSSIVGKSITVNPSKGFGDSYVNTPQANADLLQCAMACFDANYSPGASDRFILWVSLSSLDKVGHIFGPNSKEAIDMIYHMDNQIKRFMEFIYARVPKEDVLFLFTADHGIMPIPENIKELGYENARRYPAKDLIKEMNDSIEKSYGIKNLIIKFKEPQFYFNEKLFSPLPAATKKKIYGDIKKYLLKLPGVRKAWSYEELEKETFASYDLDRYLQKQLYKGRSGNLFYSTNPYTLIDEYATGTAHVSPYAYDTQVPLIFYQQGTFIKKKIATNVFMPQVPVTLATILDVPRPSASAASILPGLGLEIVNKP